MSKDKNRVINAALKWILLDVTPAKYDNCYLPLSSCCLSLGRTEKEAEDRVRHDSAHKQWTVVTNFSFQHSSPVISRHFWLQREDSRKDEELQKGKPEITLSSIEYCERRKRRERERKKSLGRWKTGSMITILIGIISEYWLMSSFFFFLFFSWF